MNSRIRPERVVRCGEVFTADEPQSAGPEKFDATCMAMTALVKYGAGMPFNRLEHLEKQLGIPLPASTQWELMKRAASSLRPVLKELIRHAAQGSVMHKNSPLRKEKRAWPAHMKTPTSSLERLRNSGAAWERVAAGSSVATTVPEAS